MSKKSKPGKHAVSGEMRTGLSANVRGDISGRLLRLLADEFVLYARARNFHWNVTGRNFRADHALFEDDYTQLDSTIDSVAERARALGAKVPARLSDFVTAARLEEVDGTALKADAMIHAMLDGHETLCRLLREDIAAADDAGDDSTTDFLTGLLESHETRAWMLRSHLEA